MDLRADLHCHSTFSDGSLTPLELVHLARKRGLQGLSITDHDTVAAYPEVQKQARLIGIRVLPGVEFSARHLGQGVHILGYAFDPTHPRIQEFCLRHAQRRKQRNQEILHKLQAKGIDVAEEDLPSSIGSIGRPHIAAVLVRKGYTASIQTAFQHYLRDGAACFASGQEIGIEETIDTIQAAKGLAILAHPHLIRSKSFLQELLQMDFDGLEGYYAYFPGYVDRSFCTIAKEKKWIVTGGSDFHGESKPFIQLGRSWVGQEVFEYLWTRYLQGLV